jgi:hypothetical protein
MHQAKKADVTISGRTLYKDGDWNTLCLPFDIDDFSGTPLEDATVMELDVDGYYDITNNNSPRYVYDSYNKKYVSGGSDFSGNVSDLRQTGFDASDGTLYLYFKNASSIGAAKPYIIKWTKPANYVAYNGENAKTCDDLVDPEFSSVKVWNYATTDKAVTSEDKLVQFKGIYDPAIIYSAAKDNLFLGAENNLYWPSTEDYTLNAFRAYFHVSLSGEQLVREIRMNLDGGNVTGVEAVQGFKSLRVQDSLPVKRIVNGRLIIERNDQLFNANGMRIN